MPAAGSQAPYIASGISREQARQCNFVQQMVSLLPQQVELSLCQDAYGKLTLQSRSSRRIALPCTKKHVGLHSFSNSVGQMFCFAPVIFSGARFGPHFDYSCIKWGTKFGSQFWLPFSVFSRSTFIKKANAKRTFTTILLPYAIIPVDFMYALGGRPHCDWLRRRRGCLDQCG